MSTGHGRWTGATRLRCKSHERHTGRLSSRRSATWSIGLGTADGSTRCSRVYARNRWSNLHGSSRVDLFENVLRVRRLHVTPRLLIRSETRELHFIDITGGTTDTGNRLITWQGEPSRHNRIGGTLLDVRESTHDTDLIRATVRLINFLEIAEAYRTEVLVYVRLDTGRWRLWYTDTCSFAFEYGLRIRDGLGAILTQYDDLTLIRSCCVRRRRCDDTQWRSLTSVCRSLYGWRVRSIASIRMGVGVSVHMSMSMSWRWAMSSNGGTNATLTRITVTNVISGRTTTHSRRAKGGVRRREGGNGCQ